MYFKVFFINCMHPDSFKFYFKLYLLAEPV